MMDDVVSFLRETLHLECSKEKTAIRHARDEGIQFLGYHLQVYDGKKTIKKQRDGRHFLWRSVRGQMQLSVPSSKVHAFCKRNRYGDFQTLKSRHRGELVNQSDYEILMTYNAELRGLANYYALAWDVKQKLDPLFYIAQFSLLKTLASKHQCSKREILKRYSKDIRIPYSCAGQQREATFSRLKDFRARSLLGPKLDTLPNLWQFSSGTEAIKRYNAGQCEYCGQVGGDFEIHHIRRLVDIKKDKGSWQRMMIARRRKTLILCTECHDLLHAGRLPDRRFAAN